MGALVDPIMAGELNVAGCDGCHLSHHSPSALMASSWLGIEGTDGAAKDG